MKKKFARTNRFSVCDFVAALLQQPNSMTSDQKIDVFFKRIDQFKWPDLYFKCHRRFDQSINLNSDTLMVYLIFIAWFVCSFSEYRIFDHEKIKAKVNNNNNNKNKFNLSELIVADLVFSCQALGCWRFVNPIRFMNCWAVFQSILESDVLF